MVVGTFARTSPVQNYAGTKVSSKGGMKQGARARLHWREQLRTWTYIGSFSCNRP